MNRSCNKRGGHDDEREKEYENDSSKKIEQAVYELGNKIKQGSVAEEIDEVAQLILNTGASCPDSVVGSIVACLLELPHKTELMATLVGVLNVGNREIITLCLDRLNSHISGDLKWWQIVQIPRVMVELTNTKVFSVEVLDKFVLETCQKLIGRSENGELVAMSVLLALPWISADILTSLKNLNDFLGLIEALINDPGRFTHVIKAFDVKIEGFESFEGDALRALFNAVKGLKGPLTTLRTEPYKTFEGALSSSKPHEEFSVSWSWEIIESVHVSEFKPLELFSDAFEEGTEDSAYSKIYCQFMLHMLIEAYELNHRRGAEVLFSALPESLAIEKILCQVLFGKLLRSCKRTSVTYYEVLLIDSCRLSRMFPPMMARSLIKLVAQMNERSADLEVLERLAGWFAHHLSHYDFKWNWAEWKDITEADGIGCKRIFLRFVMYKLLLLSYQEKMQAVLPDFMLKMMPSLSSGSKQSSNFNEPLLEFMKKRPTIEDIREHVAREGIPLQELFEVFLVMGSKTFSHLSNASERYSVLFKSASLEDQNGFISRVSEFWQDNIQNLHLVLEKLIQHQILDVNVLIEWLFEKVLTCKFDSQDSFEVQVLLKYFSSDLFFSLMSCVSDKSERVHFVRNLIDRLASLNENQTDFWLGWMVNGLVRQLLRDFFCDKSETVVQKTETLISLKENTSTPALKEMIEAAYKSITL